MKKMSNSKKIRLQRPPADSPIFCQNSTWTRGILVLTSTTSNISSTDSDVPSLPGAWDRGGKFSSFKNCLLVQERGQTQKKLKLLHTVCPFVSLPWWVAPACAFNRILQKWYCVCRVSHTRYCAFCLDNYWITDSGRSQPLYGKDTQIALRGPGSIKLAWHAQDLGSILAHTPKKKRPLKMCTWQEMKAPVYTHAGRPPWEQCSSPSLQMTEAIWLPEEKLWARTTDSWPKKWS